MLNIWASQQQGSPVPLPRPFAVADFENGTYSLNDVPAAIGDLWVAPRYFHSDEPTIVPGAGWQQLGVGSITSTGYSASPALLALMDFLGVGCSIVVDYEAVNPGTGECSFQGPVGDYPNWLLGWGIGFNAAGTSNKANCDDFFSPDAINDFGLPFSGSMGFTVSPAALRNASNGVSGANALVPPDPRSLWADPTFIDLISATQDVGSSLLIKSIKVYAAQDGPTLAALTA